MKSPKKESFVILAVLDGWGIAPDNPGNAITKAHTPNMDRFKYLFPHTQLEASGEAVGLPRSEPGSTETGHLNLGAGRIVYQELERINMSIADGTFFENEMIISAIKHAKDNKSNLHIMGLLGAGGVHSNIEHLFALIRIVKNEKFNRLYLHLFTDGRDSPPNAAKTYIEKVQEVIERENVGEIVSIMGRYWSMDRDERWERTSKAYLALTKGEGIKTSCALEAIQKSYDEGVTDEFIEPYIICDKNTGKFVNITDNDAVIFYNFRIDRPRQLTRAFVMEHFEEICPEKDYDPHTIKYTKKHIQEADNNDTKEVSFERGKKIKNLYFLMMTEYSSLLINEGAKSAFPPERIKMTLGKTLSIAGLRQLRMAESEKERFVTKYFNGLNKEIYPGEERIIVPSPRVKTYDLKPEMSSFEMTDKLLDKLNELQYQFILINYANPDMVGHSGDIEAAVKACEVVDKCVGKIANFVLAHEGALIITSDHGNAEEMINLHTEETSTEHSTNPVPFVVISKRYLGKNIKLPSGILADVAPSILYLLDVQVPSDMTGRNLLSNIVF